MKASDFVYENWNLYDAFDALIAYYLGATDSGVKDDELKDDELKDTVRKFIAELNDSDFRIILSQYIRQKYLTDEALAKGYGIKDVLDFSEWLNNELGIDV